MKTTDEKYGKATLRIGQAKTGGWSGIVDHTATAIAALKPADRIDVQSFIWVVGEYREQDLPAASA